MTHSQTITTRRRKAKAMKQLERIAKLEKKRGKKIVKPGKAAASKARSA